MVRQVCYRRRTWARYRRWTALDGKELHSLAKGQSNYPLPKDTSQKDTDGRRDRDADWGVKGSGERK